MKNLTLQNPKVSKEIANCVKIILSFFTQDQLDNLAINAREYEISFEFQLLSRWCNFYPIYKGYEFIGKVAQILNFNMYLFNAVIEFNKPEFQEKLLNYKISEESYKVLRQSNSSGWGKSGSLNYQQSTADSQTGTGSRTRSGNVESGEEFQNLDKKWEKEDDSYLSQIPILKKYNFSILESEQSASLKEKKQKFISDLEFDFKKSEISTPVLNSVSSNSESSEPSEEEEESFPLHSVSISKSATKSKSQTVSDGSGLNLRDSQSDRNSKNSIFSTHQLLSKMFNSSLKDPRETALQKLDILFHSCR